MSRAELNMGNAIGKKEFHFTAILTVLFGTI